MKIAAILSIGASFLLPFSNAKQLADDPPSYFGGVNNVAYLSWLNSNNIETKYNNSVYIPSADHTSGAAVHWSVDDEYVYLAVAAPASGWVGFGFSDAGGMLGSDMALFSTTKPGRIVDAHVVEVQLPKEDDCQDFVYVNAAATSQPLSIERSASGAVTQLIEADETEEFIMFETRRKLVTGDNQDIPLIRDNLIAVPETRIIAAWGDTPDVSFHGTNVARGSIRLYKREADFPDFDEAMARDADGSFYIGAKNYTIPSNETTYQEFCFTRKDLIEQGVPNTTDIMSVIGFNPILNDGPSAAFVHHYVVTGIFNASDDACANGRGISVVFVWAPGGGGLAFPDFLGANLFGDDSYQGFTIQIHYDNPRMVDDVVDTSGVEVYYTTTPRPVEVGVFQVGDPMVRLIGQPVGEGISSHHFECPGSCTGTYLSKDEPVTVFHEYLHMHIAGTRVTNEHIRNGTVIRTAATEVWDFDQSGNIPVKQYPYEVHAGDSFRTSCFYRDNQKAIFGLSSREEMCMAFLYYYPRKAIKVDMPQGSLVLPMMCGLGMEWLDNACFANYTSGGVLESDDDLQRVFGKQNTECVLVTDGTSDVVVDVSEESPQEQAGPLRGTPTPAPQGEENEAEDLIPAAESEGSPTSLNAPVSGAPDLALKSMPGALLALVAWLM